MQLAHERQPDERQRRQPDERQRQPNAEPNQTPMDALAQNFAMLKSQEHAEIAGVLCTVLLSYLTLRAFPPFYSFAV